MKLKTKSRKAAAKRFKITASGKILRNQTNKRHLLEHMSPGSKRQKRNALVVHKTNEKAVKEMLPGYF